LSELKFINPRIRIITLPQPRLPIFGIPDLRPVLLVRVENRLTQKSLRLLPEIEAMVLPHLDPTGTRFPAVRHAPSALSLAPDGVH